ncbi:flagellar biosynthesis anti-sigma factor FlgM [Tepidanaerobacter acetatoxydans]|uniref:flagellar biosynthesis anti-sigma factor FlgM n=1 Tax=Tepidanaerobacter acetatoxydans TaxID=499229 RepID=UPI001BD4CB86|nr:flagellar biosynthesis anti-sigma factor FlgM [Tepidanaerobacter acetatoxydans]
MNISKSQLLDGVMRTYLRNSDQIKTKADIKSKEMQADELSISEDVQEFARLVKLASKADDTRIEKVKELKTMINAGTYNIDGKLVADKIIEEHFTEKLI